MNTISSIKVNCVQVQDFRFLCPNDTAFDQENQVCEDWYNIDCEASTLYYSDNFDLFRIGKRLSTVKLNVCETGSTRPVEMGG